MTDSLRSILEVELGQSAEHFEGRLLLNLPV